MKTIQLPGPLFLCAAVVLALLLAGCSRPAKLAAVGKWQKETGAETIEFRSDGTCQGSDRYGRVVTGTFTLIGADRMKLDLTTTSEDKATGARGVDRSSGVVRIAVNGDTLTMTEEGGSATHYRKAQ